MAENIIEVRVSEHPICDFCSSAEPRFMEQTPEFDVVEIPGVLTTRSGAGWASCAPCHQLIELRAWQRLEKRAIRQLKRKHPGIPLDVIANGVHTEHVRFRAHQT